MSAFRGTTEMNLDHDTVRDAIQYWLKNAMSYGRAPKVIKVRMTRRGRFIVTLVDPDDKEPRVQP